MGVWGPTVETYADVRWTAPSSGLYSINAIYTGVWNLDDVGDVHILVGGVSMFDSSVAYQSSTSYANSIPLTVGETVDFDFGNENNGNNVRACWIQSISPTPEPSTLALLAAGTIGIVGYAWRRRKKIAGRSSSQDETAPAILSFPSYGAESKRRAA